MSEHVMIDIETLGLEPGSSITEIGAVDFDADGIGGRFHMHIDVESCTEAGLDLGDAETLKWWFKQDDKLLDRLLHGDPLEEVLLELATWLPDGAYIWANSPSFDCAHLERAYGAINEEPPWSYHQRRDYRTLTSLDIGPGAPEMEGQEHNALHDAMYQARVASMYFSELEGETDD